MRICVPIQERTQKAALKRIDELEGKADLAEIWLDHVEDLDVKNLIIKSRLPLVCVCKKPNEKGYFRGSYEEMADLLRLSAKSGAAYIDAPFSMPKNLIGWLHGCLSASGGCMETMSVRPSCLQMQPGASHKAKLILSFHNFKKTPPLKTMLRIAREMKERGADIAKIAVMAKSYEDTFNVILLAQILQSENIPHILIAMGEKGILSRVITPFLGGEMMFAPLTKNRSSASGQLTVDELRKAWKSLEP